MKLLECSRTCSERGTLGKTNVVDGYARLQQATSAEARSRVVLNFTTLVNKCMFRSRLELFFLSPFATLCSPDQRDD